ncbi:MAG TPA: hypothetical protein VFX20_00680 [Steroidobacteraceae bacterium]|nr:hypothetical protein [Steroidobacteraceae bacterium]
MTFLCRHGRGGILRVTLRALFRAAGRMPVSIAFTVWVLVRVVMPFYVNASAPISVLPLVRVPILRAMPMPGTVPILMAMLIPAAMLILTAMPIPASVRVRVLCVVSLHATHHRPSTGVQGQAPYAAA